LVLTLRLRELPLLLSSDEMYTLYTRQAHPQRHADFSRLRQCSLSVRVRSDYVMG
ncbi:hypothetical protein M404DRAFT_558694, partial [Pisolithus tinctorius Marx 270]